MSPEIGDHKHLVDAYMWVYGDKQALGNKIRVVTNYGLNREQATAKFAEKEKLMEER
jgi:hypothetical protein